MAPATARECDCPEWAVRCAHLGDNTLWLAIKNEATLCCYREGSKVADFVVISKAKVGPCPVTGLLTHAWYEDRAYAGHSESDALTVFHEAEIALLRGDA